MDRKAKERLLMISNTDLMLCVCFLFSSPLSTSAGGAQAEQDLCARQSPSRQVQLPKWFSLPLSLPCPYVKFHVSLITSLSLLPFQTVHRFFKKRKSRSSGMSEDVFICIDLVQEGFPNQGKCLWKP
uniref:Secreted protein n=1 Tax=Micrurus lemniscatus lemniscatus TaxID=129467 RepID=A0A2D4HZ67_MICLE